VRQIAALLQVATTKPETKNVVLKFRRLEKSFTESVPKPGIDRQATLHGRDQAAALHEWIKDKFVHNTTFLAESDQ